MSITLTQGVTIMPPAFEDGLDVWSSGDGRPSDPTYDTATNAAFVPADQDFGGCLEIRNRLQRPNCVILAKRQFCRDAIFKLGARQTDQRHLSIGTHFCMGRGSRRNQRGQRGSNGHVHFVGYLWQGTEISAPGHRRSSRRGHAMGTDTLGHFGSISPGQMVVSFALLG